MRSVGKNGYRSKNIWNRLIFKTESIEVEKDSCMKTYEDSFYVWEMDKIQDCILYWSIICCGYIRNWKCRLKFKSTFGILIR